MQSKLQSHTKTNELTENRKTTAKRFSRIKKITLPETGLKVNFDSDSFGLGVAAMAVNGVRTADVISCESINTKLFTQLPP